MRKFDQIRSLLLNTLLLIVLGFSHLAKAQDSGSLELPTLAQNDTSTTSSLQTEESAQHILMGHRFLPSLYIPNPFAVPTFELDWSFGTATLTREFPLQTRELKIGSAGPRFEAQIKLMKNLMLIAGFSGNVVFGINDESIAFYGASARYRPRLGLLWQFVEQDQWATSFALEWERPYKLQASPVEAGSRAIENAVTGIDQPLTDEVEINRWRPTFRTAYSFNAVVGVTGFVGLEVDSASLNDVSTNTSQYLLGASLDADFKPLWNVPVGVTLSYRYSKPEMSGRDAVGVGSLGIFETFSKRFNAGLEVGKLDSGDDHATIGSIMTRYYY